MPQALRAQSLVALAALVLSACATTSPRVSSSDVEVLEKVLRARSARYLIAQGLRLEAVGARLLRALPDAGPDQRVPYLGLVVDDATETLADALGVGKREGVVVLGVVPGGPAERGGIEAGDYLERIGPLTISTAQDLAALDELEVNRPIPVLIRRGELVVAALLEPEYLPWNVAFKIVRDDVVNAYSAPAAVTLTTGMLRFLRSDDELAVVVTHELAHITRNHAVPKLGLAVPTIVLSVIAAIVVPGSQRLVSTVVEKVVANVIRGVLTKVDWDMEREADVVGFVYLHAAGYDPAVAIALWERFAVELHTGRSYAFISDHPPSSERLIRLQRLLEAVRAGVPPQSILVGDLNELPPP
jgi:hypothetical protein